VVRRDRLEGGSVLSFFLFREFVSELVEVERASMTELSLDRTETSTA
jgi:hypothetical protein